MSNDTPLDTEYRELVRRVSDAGWNVAEIQHNPHSVRVRFRNAPHLTDREGMQTRYAIAMSATEALRLLLKVVENERDDPASATE